MLHFGHRSSFYGTSDLVMLLNGIQMFSFQADD